MTMTMTSSSSGHDMPPPLEPINSIDLVSVEDGIITRVSVYSGRAEITRLFKFVVKTGQNQLNVLGLPWAMHQDSLRVEGRGSATIHDVTISRIVPPAVQTTSPELESLLSKEKKTEKALARAQKSLSSLETYIASVQASDLEVGKLRDVVHQYDITAEELDDKVTALEAELDSTKRAINEERKRLVGHIGNPLLNLKATIGVFADCEGEVEIVLVYAVNNATWNAGYDIRVDMQAKEKPVDLVYKALITQSTGEDWNDVPLTLETAAPTFGVGVPTLDPWTLSVFKSDFMSFAKLRSANRGYGAPAPTAYPLPQASPTTPAGLLERGERLDYLIGSLPPAIDHRGLEVSSKGGLSATFSVPGLISIPSDNVSHNVTITKLSLDAEMSWVCVPKRDTRVHLKAKIKNASEYTLLAGNASVYVDGSFISKSDVPLVSPEEKFDCPLGLDPAIRVTYHPRTKNVAQSGFYMGKTSNHTFSQRVTVHNTKSTSSGPGVGSGILDIKIIDQVPVSEDSTITVKLVQPALTVPVVSGALSPTKSNPKAVLAPVKVSPGVTALWDGADEDVDDENKDLEAIGREGRFFWNCFLPPQGKIALTLQWEVAYPLNTNVVGL